MCLKQKFKSYYLHVLSNAARNNIHNYLFQSALVETSSRHELFIASRTNQKMSMIYSGTAIKNPIQ